MKQNRVRQIAVLLLAAATLVSAAACSRSKVNKANYDRIATGMTPAEVEVIMGPGTEQASTAVAVPGATVAGVTVPGTDTSAKVITWNDGQKVISVTFVNGKMMSKTQFGL